MTHSLLRAREFPYRKNSLNLFRLVLAFLVLLAHGYYVVGRTDSPGFNGENLGGWAVIGFFVLSGFLITRSRMRTDPGTFLLHRIARIMPAFVVCLLVTALVFGPIAQLLTHGSLAGYFTTDPTPLEYVWGNLFLRIEHYQIGTSLSDVPYPNAWNGSLWTLYFEFLCYLSVWVLGGLAVFRRSISVVAGLWAASVIVRVCYAMGVTGGLDGNFGLFSRLLPYFLGGSLIYLVVQRWGLVPLVGMISIPLAAVLMVFVPVAGGPIAAPLIGYALLYLSTVIPQPAWIARNDVSYGFYIYAWPVQQLVVILGGAGLGIAVYTGITTVVTFALGWLSWMLVERHFIRFARGSQKSEKAVLTPAGAAAPSADAPPATAG
ncbi:MULTISPECIES: acyltransferase [unclassified Microbacterium]|uniref:acyltransferase family protein n=1 Tax=unclassified Microbacterium TaxID=2609290 RepID=UPI0006F7B163|nr:acyltransferase [Microbacterium sp. Root553]KQZ24486.1 hypothetical protein ASD43_09070 [Microbacterium sp. Root553]